MRLTTASRDMAIITSSRVKPSWRQFESRQGFIADPVQSGEDSGCIGCDVVIPGFREEYDGIPFRRKSGPRQPGSGASREEASPG